jgi:hypothetical protein
MLYLLLVEREKKEKKERNKERKRKKWPIGLFSPGWDMPCWLCHVGFFGY